MTVRDEIVHNMADSFCVKRYGGGLAGVSPHLAANLIEEFEFVYDTAVAPIYEELGQRLLAVTPPPRPRLPAACQHTSYAAEVDHHGQVWRSCADCGAVL